MNFGKKNIKYLHKLLIVDTNYIKNNYKDSKICGKMVKAMFLWGII